MLVQRKKLNSSNGRMQSLVSFVLTGIGVSTVLCLPILLNVNGTNSNAEDALTNQSMGDDSDVAVFGIRGPLTGQPLIGQSRVHSAQVQPTTRTGISFPMPSSGPS